MEDDNECCLERVEQSFEVNVEPPSLNINPIKPIYLMSGLKKLNDLNKTVNKRKNKRFKSNNEVKLTSENVSTLRDEGYPIDVSKKFHENVLNNVKFMVHDLGGLINNVHFAEHYFSFAKVL